MKRYRLAILIASLLSIVTASTWAADDPKAVLDKATEAIGGAKKLSEAKGYSWKAKGKITFGGMESAFTTDTLVEGNDHYRSKFEGDFGGNKVEAVVVINGDKGWVSFGGMTMALEGDALANEKRNAYLVVGPALLIPLKGEGFELKAAGEAKVDDKPAVRLKVDAKDGKDFTIYFDPKTYLPIKQTADVVDFMGTEYKQETVFSEYKDFEGIKKATKIEQRRDGETFLQQEITEFKALKEVPADSFAEPK
jgi:hypothetical protein